VNIYQYTNAPVYTYTLIHIIEIQNLITLPCGIPTLFWDFFLIRHMPFPHEGEKLWIGHHEESQEKEIEIERSIDKEKRIQGYEWSTKCKKDSSGQICQYILQIAATWRKVHIFWVWWMIVGNSVAQRPIWSCKSVWRFYWKLGSGLVVLWTQAYAYV